MDISFEKLPYLFIGKPNLADGKRQLLTFVRDLFPEFDCKIIEEIDIYKLQSEFQSWVLRVLKNEPHPKRIKSIWFGLFDAIYDDDCETVELYLMGSTVTPEEDLYDWACVDKDSYWPDERYAQIETFFKLYQSLQTVEVYRSESDDLRILIFSFLVYLLVINAIDNIKEVLLDGRTEMYIGGGFDDMGVYIYGKLTPSGLIELKVQE